jgi:hypothetical protein
VLQDIRSIATAGLLAGGLLAAQAAPAMAYITGGCTGTASDTTGHASPANLASDRQWNVSKDSNLSGQGDAPADQTKGYAYAMAFGFPLSFIPIAGGTGHGTHGSGSLDISKIAPYTRVISAAGASDSCSGYIVINVTDTSALDTVAGKASILAFLVGLLGLAALGLRKRPARAV